MWRKVEIFFFFLSADRAGNVKTGKRLSSFHFPPCPKRGWRGGAALPTGLGRSGVSRGRAVPGEDGRATPPRGTPRAPAWPLVLGLGDSGLAGAGAMGWGSGCSAGVRSPRSISLTAAERGFA